MKNPTPAERAFLDDLKHWLDEETGYQSIQGTRPQTLSFALTESPSGLAAWILEKFRAWSDCGGDVESVFTRDQMLANISFYWFTGAIGSSFFPYYFRRHRPWMIPQDAMVTAPTGYAEFPCEILKPPRSLAEKMFSDIRRWSVMPHGGHFAAMEQPQRSPTRFGPSSALCGVEASRTENIARRGGRNAPCNVGDLGPLLRNLRGRRLSVVSQFQNKAG